MVDERARVLPSSPVLNTKVTFESQSGKPRGSNGGMEEWVTDSQWRAWLMLEATRRVELRTRVEQNSVDSRIAVVRSAGKPVVHFTLRTP